MKTFMTYDVIQHLSVSCGQFDIIVTLVLLMSSLRK